MRWRIRVSVPGDPRSQELLAAALAGYRVRSRLVSPDGARTIVDMIVEPSGAGALGALLSDLHVISPQVFVRNADHLPSSATA